MSTGRTTVFWPGGFAPRRMEMPSLGWTRIVMTFGSAVSLVLVCQQHAGGPSLKVMLTSVTRSGSRFPARTKKGTPAQRQFWISSFRATNESVTESLGTFGSSR